MNKFLLSLFLIIPLIFIGQVTTNPSPIEIDQSVIITVDLNSTATDCNGLVNPAKVYMHSGVGSDTNAWEYDVVGNWGMDDGIGEMTNNNDGTWSITLTPNTYFTLTAGEEASVSKMGMVFRNAAGTQELKATGCVDFIFNVGSFQVTMINPDAGQIKYKNSGESMTIMAQNAGGTATYELFGNGTSLNTQTTTFYTYNHTNITQNTFYELVITQGSSSLTKPFTVLINSAPLQTMPSGIVDGINYDVSDATKATLVLNAPLKEFVYVAGSFNNWEPTANYAMKKDNTTGKFWLELTGLTDGQLETYQYWVFETTPLTNSAELVKTADPYSTLVLSPFDDPWIPSASYPNLPTYPWGQEREVTVLQTNQPEYSWNTTNFVKPKKEDLIIYEVLIRDFDANRNFQTLIDRIDYFKNLNINAIELMPIMEYEGNEGWGYNPSFHLALDKYYGTADKFKEFVDLCHQNGIAVILDVALNHAMGRNAMNRMWMIDTDGDGWGEPSSENPYMNTSATHSYSVGSDYNHSQDITKVYAKRVVKHWIEEYHIDGFRWDLTKGFTQNCAGSDNCTNSYQQDRVDILKDYADYSWSLDPTHYVIFEHLGNDNEEQQWANYRINESPSKGVMMWGKMTEPYNELTMGQSGNKNINRMGHVSRGFTEKRLVGYAESHDEERLMYKNVTYGNGNVQNVNIALSRMSALGAVTLTIPGPKMIWHFGELGMDNSINTCTDETVSSTCRLATKPQPQWVENWMGTTNRRQIYDDWAKINKLKTTQDVFEGDYSITSGTLTPKIYIWDDNIPTTELKNVVVLANFDITAQNVTPNFPYLGTWYDLMDDSTFTATNSAINLQPGEFKIFGNQSGALSTDNYDLNNLVKLYPN
ncbi:MAG: alpha-amylase family glycosyl hydrolase, partial [Flavobacteriaceae bacterium]